ncbi:GNS1/SUR4 membrane protein [Suillus clintonianus]|uniref:GNS1/SUR4 membrane protein n=1 Tax=Suillus clintonianus TaxID=1904413 RepID=UPI001B863EBC|nr:GNS1/SUR4 membrane protein [Suillus clintonianus]KAG2111357.1 GNS1/SUR4 membrane protein [Suillus clintonianus]
MTPFSDLLLSIVPADSIPAHLKSYIPGVSPFSTWPVVSTLIAFYLVSILTTREFMKNRPSLKLQTLFRFHNVLLSTGSLVLLLLIAEEVVSVWMEVGTYDSMCAPSSWTDKLEFYYIVNYYFKYYEFLDTLFLVLKKKPLTFLHVFHHASTVLLAFVQLNGKLSPSWTVVSINLLVHVVMYYYYYATAGGAKFWWKKYLTAMQIIQFIIDLFIFYFGLYQHYVHKYFPALPHFGDCSGSEPAALFGCALLTSYLMLFVDFYMRTYSTTPSSKVKTNGVGQTVVPNGISHMKH